MDVSSAGLHLIAGFEGFVPVPYNDVAGNATIGYGRLLHTGPVTEADRTKWGRITVDHGLQLLHEDAAQAVAAVNKGVRVRLGVIPARRQARFDALVSLTFNIGAGGFGGSSLLRAINAKGAPRDWRPLGPLWLEWDHAGGAVVQGLLTRRTREFSIFSTGKYPLT